MGGSITFMKNYEKNTFSQLKNDDNPKDVIKVAFDQNLDISGGWGYDKASALIIHSTNTKTLPELEYTLVMMRSYLEMNLTQPKESRYSAINLVEKDRKMHQDIDGKIYEKVIYELSAMLEDKYNAFIQEYKEGQNNSTFDVNEHFERRKENTIKRDISCLFDLTNVNK